MLSEISWMEFLSVTSVLLLFYYLWILYAFYRVQKKGSIQQNGEPWTSSWLHPKPTYFVASDVADDYQVISDPVESEEAIAAFATQLGDYLSTLADSSINLKDIRQQLISLLESDQRLHSPDQRERLKDIIVKQAAKLGLDVREEMDLNSLWQGFS
ncbi:MAG: hypothetical protein ACRDE7_00680 [Sphingobacterium sp.]